MPRNTTEEAEDTILEDGGEDTIMEEDGESTHQEPTIRELLDMSKDTELDITIKDME